MKVTQVALMPTEASQKAGRPSLTPELLAASGARYSRSNEGLEAILARIDPNNLDKSVDGIFKMIDYGHQSIADMAPVAIFMDGVSLYLAYLVWSLCPTAGGQESSTRYINYGASQTLDAPSFGIAPDLREEWNGALRDAFRSYENALALWENVAAQNPDVMRIPRALLEDTSGRAQKQVARMERNYAFDRARYFLPAGAPTNLMLVMSARGWVSLCQHLLSHPLPEANALGALVRDELALAAPRLLKHATAKTSLQNGWKRELELWRGLARREETNDALASDENLASEYSPDAFLDILMPQNAGGDDFAADLSDHDNRYAWIGTRLQRTGVRFGWQAVAFAEARDLNRHRTGTKWCPFAPRGFYAAQDELPIASNATDDLRVLAQHGKRISSRARDLLRQGDATFVYWTLLGTQYFFEHTTTADKFLYEAELRTGTGAHPRYARHLHDTLALWHEKFPQTRGLVLEGSAEPE